ncbi:hypothetical protein [Wenjunlia tyrosinilytica]|uniref:hypothetical protein n=1 Tax=Wenjunlia tyrosinilytica TaxID=1544741 RepID=UPI00166C124B|nr:hypothetical protein [Wenjunlia tyrosinilytica]
MALFALIRSMLSRVAVLAALALVLRGSKASERPELLVGFVDCLVPSRVGRAMRRVQDMTGRDVPR